MLAWGTVAELYRARWAIETFFKKLKQTLQLRDFVGYNEKAVKWQVWTRLLAHLLLRFHRHVSKWTLSFSRLARTPDFSPYGMQLAVSNAKFQVSLFPYSNIPSFH